MHEVSLVESILGMIEDERRKQAFGRVRVIRLHIGALSCVEPHALKFCFEAVASGTIAEGAALDIETIAGVGVCVRCDRSVPMTELFDACPLCGYGTLHITAGKDLRLAEMEVD
jgi:hydrogenase nickel incorporation protein HypA/HybF